MAAAPTSSIQPVSTSQLQKIAKEACDQALVLAESYSHAQTEAWNNTIISAILQSLLSATSDQDPKYKFAVNSTIIQHLTDPEPSGTGTQTAGPDSEASAAATNGAESNSFGVSASQGRRGMHSATGAYWNNDTDGMWNYKYEGGISKGMDVVVSVIWIHV